MAIIVSLKFSTHSESIKGFICAAIW